MPVAVTTPTAAPFETVVPANIMLSFAWIRTLFATGSVCFMTVSDSPVKAPSSVRTVVVLRRRMRTSAGTCVVWRACESEEGPSRRR